MPGEVIEGHAKYEHDCNNCHQRFDKAAQIRLCLDCHKDVAADVRAKSRLHGRLEDTTCRNCHTDHKGRRAAIAPVDKKKFDHGRTDFKLLGAHREAKCESCHQPKLKYRQAPKLCNDCHKKDDQEKGHRGGLGEKCETCHNEKGWKNSSFDHDDTKFPLRDKHKDAKCDTCHKGGVSGPNAKLKVDTACVACHRKNDDEKGHKGRYGDKCETCHDAREWKKSFFNHDKETKYPLKGKHADAKCDTCHLPEKGPIYKSKLETACIACHKKDDKHKGQLGNKCETCHDEKKWTGVPYDHNKSRYPLTGSHAKVDCKKCHQTPAYKDAPMACNGCHEKDDKHKGRFGAKCESCHYTGTWKAWDFDHDKTRYPLDGAHKKVDCYECHKETLGAQSKPGRACVACHAKDDVHDGGFSAQCERCHVTANWKKVRR